MTEKPESLIPRFPQVVSFFRNAFGQEPDEQPKLGDVLDEIRKGTWAKEIDLLRKRLERGDQKGYDDAKRGLPAFTMSSALLTRDKSVPLEHRVIAHSGILQADFDRKENPQLNEVDEVKQLLAKDPHVAFVFTSPSGRGVKAGVVIDRERHRGSFFGAENHFLKKYGLQMDRSTKDVTRMCFVSSDPGIIVTDDAYPVEPISESRPTGGDSYSAPMQTTAADVQEMLEFVPRRPAYEDWLRIASAVWSVLPMAEGCQVLNTWSPEEKAGEYTEKWKHRLEDIGIGTLVWYAQQHGFDARGAARRKLWAGRIRFSEPTLRDAEEDFTNDPAPDSKQLELTRDFVAACADRNQLGDAELWSHMARGKKLFDHLGRHWKRYEAGVWERDDMQKTLVDASMQIGAAYEQLADSLRDDMADNPAENPKKDPRMKKVQALQQRVWKLRTTGYMSGVMTFAESILGTKSTMFDQQPGLLAVRNGVVDFANGVFREHRSADKITQRTLCDFNPDAACPRWERFLDYFLEGDQEMIRYLARAVGYSLTGFVDKDVLFFVYGKGANGKSTYISALSLLLGELMTTVSIEALLAKASDNNFDYKKAQMEGKRLVVSDEIPENRTLNESSIKSLVGGDAITARRPYEKPYVFEPTHKLWLVGNHKPTIKGTDYGIWRRVHLIPWLKTMPEGERRPRHEVLSEFREELSGILNWAINGYIEMVDLGGLKPPKKVLDATKEYQSDSDQFARFLEERTERNTVEAIGVKELREVYQAWCEDEGEPPRYRDNRSLSSYLRDAGYTVKPHGNKKRSMVFGLMLNAYEDAV